MQMTDVYWEINAIISVISFLSSISAVQPGVASPWKEKEEDKNNAQSLNPTINHLSVIS
jgi:hypothetical protein